MDTYRIRLEREKDGKTLYQWGKIPHAKVRPLISALERYLPMMIRAARTRIAAFEFLAALGVR